MLEGITRQSIWSIATDLGYPVSEGLVSRDQLYSADEVFVCGTVAEVIGLSEIDFRTVGDGATGPITRAIQGVYHQAIHGRDPRYKDWLTYVN